MAATVHTGVFVLCNSDGFGVMAAAIVLICLRQCCCAGVLMCCG